MIRRFLCAVALAAVSVTGASAYDASDDKSRVTLVYDQVLPNVPGKACLYRIKDRREAS
jgi:hypothetical protein